MQPNAYPLLEILTSPMSIDTALSIFDSSDIDSESDFERRFGEFFYEFIEANFDWFGEHQKRVKDIYYELSGGHRAKLPNYQAVSKLMLFGTVIC